MFFDSNNKSEVFTKQAPVAFFRIIKSYKNQYCCMLEISVASSVKTVKLPLLTFDFSVFLTLIRLGFLKVVSFSGDQFDPPSYFMNN